MQNTRDPPLGLSALLGDGSVAVLLKNLSDARRLSVRRPTIGRQMFVSVSPTEATDNRIAGQQSTGTVFVVHCSGIERRTAINSATDI